MSASAGLGVRSGAAARNAMLVPMVQVATRSGPSGCANLGKRSVHPPHHYRQAAGKPEGLGRSSAERGMVGGAAHFRQLVRTDPCRGQELFVPAPGRTIENTRRGGRHGDGPPHSAQQLKNEVLGPAQPELACKGRAMALEPA